MSSFNINVIDYDADYQEGWVPEEVHYLLEDHSFHVEQHPDCFFEYTGAVSVFPF